MGRLRLPSLVWVGSILAGFGLGAYVLVAWPEPTTRLIPLPYGESMPKTPGLVSERQAPVAKVVASAAGVVTPPQALPTSDEAPARELAGPPPVASELESDSYRPESAEQLGATPLPGMAPALTP